MRGQKMKGKNREEVRIKKIVVGVEMLGAVSGFFFFFFCPAFVFLVFYFFALGLISTGHRPLGQWFALGSLCALRYIAVSASLFFFLFFFFSSKRDVGQTCVTADSTVAD